MISRYERFSSAVFCIYRDIQKIQRVEMERHGLKGSHALCLLTLNRHPEGITAAHLCEICDKDKAAISRTLSELEHKGLVQREEPHVYRAALKLTEEGRETAGQVEQRAQLAVRKATEGLTETQGEALYEALDCLAGNLQKICKDGL